MNIITTNFSTSDLWYSKLLTNPLQVHSKVVFEMSEEGSQVSNKTEDGRVPLKVTVNRPFLFAIIEGNSNAILMLGKIMNPAV